MERVFGVAAILSLSACTQLLAYPSEEPEDCDNTVDDDLDGLVDCADVGSCASSCTEETRETCSNDIDEDGDGYEDWADPTCWSFGSAQLSECVSVRGSSATLAPRIGAWTWPEPVGAAPTEHDDPGGSAATALGFREAGHAAMTSTSVLGGAWRGTRVRARLYATGDTSVGIVVGDVGAGIELGRARLLSIRRLQEGSDNLRGPGDVAADLLGTAGWWTIEIAIDAGTGPEDVHVTAAATRDGSRAVTSVEIDDQGWPATGDLQVRVVLSAYSGVAGTEPPEALLGDVEVVRPGGRTCDDGGSFADGGILIGAAARPRARACNADMDPCGGRAPCIEGFCEDPVVIVTGRAVAMVMDSGRPTVWRRGDDGALVASAAEWPASIVSAPRPTWDAEGARFVAAGSERTCDGACVSVALFESRDDGATWVRLGDAGLGPWTVGSGFTGSPTSPMASSGYLLRRGIVDAAIEHEIWSTEVRDGARGVVFARSADGAPGSFAEVRFVSVEALLGPGDARGDIGLGSVGVSAIGNDYVFSIGRLERVGPSDYRSVVRSWVELASGELREIAGAALEVGHAPGYSFTRPRASIVESRGAPGGFDALFFYERTAPVLFEWPAAIDVATLSIRAPAACATPLAETCNATDDDCDGAVDEDGC